MLCQGQIVVDVHQEAAYGNVGLCARHDRHIHTVNGHVVFHEVKWHCDVIRGPCNVTFFRVTCRIRCADFAVVPAPLEVRHLKRLRCRVVARVLIIIIRRQGVVKRYWAQSCDSVGRDQRIVGSIAQSVDHVGHDRLTVHVHRHHDIGLVSIAHVVDFGGCKQSVRQLAQRPSAVLVVAALFEVRVAHVVVDAGIIFRSLVDFNVVDFPRVAPGPDPTETNPYGLLATSSFGDVKLQNRGVVSLVSCL